jgi:hypothetical protein
MTESLFTRIRSIVVAPDFSSHLLVWFRLVVVVSSQPLGALTRLRIRHNNKGLGPAWHLKQVHVVDLTAADDATGFEREVTQLLVRPGTNEPNIEQNLLLRLVVTFLCNRHEWCQPVVMRREGT